MKRKLITIALMGLLGSTLALGSVAASAHERIGFGVNIGVPAYGYAPAPAYGYAAPAPVYYGAPAYYDAYYGAPYVGVGVGGIWYDHWGHRHWGHYHR
jgi:hypothetical protein